MNKGNTDKAQAQSESPKKSFFTPTEARKECLKAPFDPTPRALNYISNLNNNDIAIWSYIFSCGLMKNGSHFNPRQIDIEDFARVSTSTVKRSMKKLELHKMLKIKKSRKGSGQADIYQVSLPKSWVGLEFNIRCQHDWINLSKNTIVPRKDRGQREAIKPPRQKVQSKMSCTTVQNEPYSTVQNEPRVQSKMSYYSKMHDSEIQTSDIQESETTLALVDNSNVRQNDHALSLEEIGQKFKKEEGKCPALEIMIQLDFLKAIWGYSSEAKRDQRNQIAKAYFEKHGAQAFLDKCIGILAHPNLRDFHRRSIQYLLEGDYPKTV